MNMHPVTPVQLQKPAWSDLFLPSYAAKGGCKHFAEQHTITFVFLMMQGT